MKAFCQCLAISIQLAGILKLLREDIKGREAKSPAGFRGIFTTIEAAVIMAAIYYIAGLYSEILN